MGENLIFIMDKHKKKLGYIRPMEDGLMISFLESVDGKLYGIMGDRKHEIMKASQKPFFYKTDKSFDAFVLFSGELIGTGFRDKEFDVSRFFEETVLEIPFSFELQMKWHRCTHLQEESFFGKELTRLHSGAFLGENDEFSAVAVPSRYMTEPNPFLGGGRWYPKKDGERKIGKLGYWVKVSQKL